MEGEDDDKLYDQCLNLQKENAILKDA